MTAREKVDEVLRTRNDVKVVAAPGGEDEHEYDVYVELSLHFKDFDVHVFRSDAGIDALLVWEDKMLVNCSWPATLRYGVEVKS